MNAKEMFEALGYKEKPKNGNWLRFKEERQFRTNTISFDLQGKSYSTHATDEFGDTVYFGVTNELHLAITQQMKELGWLK